MFLFLCATASYAKSTIAAMPVNAIQHTRFVRWAFVAFLTCSACHPAYAQRSTGAYSLVVRGVPLATALETLIARTKIDLAYDPPLVREKRANCAVREASAEDLLRCVLRGTGLDFYRLSSGLYVLIKTPETVPLYGGLQGIVVDAETRQPLPRSHVMLADRASGTTANDAGMFAFSRLPPGRYVVIATHVGYRSASIPVEVPPGRETRAEVALEADPVVVKPIVIDGLQWRLPSADLGRVSLTREQLREEPALGGSDVLVGLNSLLGVRVSDATADIHVQGGETGEHQLRLDGAPVFLPLNFASFVGPFSPFAIGSITVHKAGFGASEGSQISGVIDLRHDLNSQEPRHLDFQIDPLSLNARFSINEAEPGGVQTVFTAAGRTSIWSLYAPPPLETLLSRWNTTDPFLYTLFDRSDDNPRFGQADTTTGNPVIGFRDLHAATRIRFGPLRNLYSSAYFGQTRLGSDLAHGDVLAPSALQARTSRDSERIRDLFTWDMGIGQARYEVVVGSKTLASVGARGSYYHVGHDYSVPDSASESSSSAETGSDLERIDDGNRIYEIAAEGRIDHALNQQNNLSLGAELIYTGSQFDVLGTQKFPIHHESSSWRLATFLEDELTLTNHLSSEVGTRATYLSSRGKVYAEPRIALRYDRSRSPLGPLSARVSTGLFNQFVSQFDVSSRSPRALISSTRFWLASDSTVSPPAAMHYAAELLLMPSSSWTVRLEGYYKRQHRMLAVNYATVAEADRRDMAQNEFLREIRGAVRGAGLQIRRKIGAGHAEIRYEYTAAVTRDTLFAGEPGAPIHTSWNEPHRLEVALDLVPWKNLTLLARWRGVWDRTWGFRQAYYDFVGAFNQIASDLPPDLIPKAQRQIDRYRLAYPEEHRLPPIYQLDVSAAYDFDLLESSFQIRIDVLNVLDRENVAERHLVFDPERYYVGEDTGFLVREERPLLPRLVSVALRWTL